MTERAHSSTLFSSLPSSVWFNRILPLLDHQSRAVFACACQESHGLINNYCGTFVGYEKGSHSKPSRDIRSVRLRLENQKIVAYQASISLDHAIAVVIVKGDLQPHYLVNGIMTMVSYTSLRSIEFVNTALLTTDIAITLLDSLPAVKTFVFDGCIGIVPSLLFEYMRNNSEVICRKTIKYAPSFNTGGLGTFRSWAGKVHMFWAALLAIYMPVIMDVAPQLMEENSIFFKAMIRVLSEPHTKAQVIRVLHALKIAAIESPPEFIRDYGMDKMDMEDEGFEYGDDDDILTKRLQLMSNAARHAYFVPVRQLNEIAYLLAPQEHRKIMTSGNSAGRRFHPCDEHGPLPGCMFQGVNLQHEKNDNNQCLVCNIQEEWNNFVCYNATSREFNETQWRFDQFVADGGLMPRYVSAKKEPELENDDVLDSKDITGISEFINHAQEHETKVTPSRNNSHSLTDLDSESESSNEHQDLILHDEAATDHLNDDSIECSRIAIRLQSVDDHHNKSTISPPPDFYPLSIHDFPTHSHALLNHYFNALENVSKLAERLCNTYCPLSIRGLTCPLPKCTKKPSAPSN